MSRRSRKKALPDGRIVFSPGDVNKPVLTINTLAIPLSNQVKEPF